MTSSYIRQSLPSTADLPYSDGMPVDNEDQNLLPNLLLHLLTHLWADRMDWFFGVDMAVYHETGISPKIPVVPDAFLSLGVERKRGGKSRLSYAVWEDGAVPTMVLEMVSHKPGKEYDKKLLLYRDLGVLYYVVYNPEYWQRDQHNPFEVYKLESGEYRLQSGEPYWMPEVGLGIGRYQTEFGKLPQEILTWYDERGNRHFNEAEQERLRAERERIWAEQARVRAERAEAAAEQERARAEQERVRAEQERVRAERFEAILRAQGIEPDDLV
ncbi:MAG: Uma2 family endonuclease [Phormidesmis sp.]